LLERVPLLERDLGDYAELVGAETVERIRGLAEPLQGARILHLNATAYGGGVAELLSTHVALLRSVGIDAVWEVMQGSDAFFHITKTIHNGLQGADVDWTAEMERTFLERSFRNSLLLEGEWDFVVMHDPQPAAILSFLRGRPTTRPETKWVWRCHIDLTEANPAVWEFLRPYVECHDASVWTMRDFVPASLSMDSVHYAPPCIDPHSVKNLDLGAPFVRELCKQYGVDVDRPLMVQVSRFDPWKDPVGVVKAYRIVKESIPDVQLVLAGSMATDDPEGFHVWEHVEAARGDDHDVHLLSNLHQVGNVQINAFQRAADVVIQKSLREGFGLTVAEGLWKGRPVVGGRAGGITLQIVDGDNGYLVGSVEECAKRTIDLLQQPDTADAMGANGREWVREHFLATRELEDWLSLFATL
jgi:trehalose synthase